MDGAERALEEALATPRATDRTEAESLLSVVQGCRTRAEIARAERYAENLLRLEREKKESERRQREEREQLQWEAWERPKAERKAEEEPRPLSDPVTIQFEVDLQADRRAQVRGRTNLPPKTQLGVTVEEDGPTGFRGSVSIHVAGDGSFQGGPFGQANGLPDGIYCVEVVMPIPRVQPAPVRKVIGEQGEHLQGPLTEKGNLGVTVWVRDKFTVGKGAAAQRERLLAEARQYEQYSEILTLCTSGWSRRGRTTCRRTWWNGAPSRGSSSKTWKAGGTAC